MARLLARSLPIAALLVGLIAVGGPAPADAVTECPQGGSIPANTADVSIGQTTTAATDTSGALVVTYTIAVVNAGPCPIPTLTIHDDLPAPASAGTWAIVAMNPGSWACGPTTSGNTPGSFDCSLNAGLGVPGTGSITLQVTYATPPTDATNYAAITAPLAYDGCDVATAICETNADNDESWGAYLSGSTQLTDGTAGTADQFRAITGPGSPVSAYVSHTASNCQGGRKRSQCPLGGQVVNINVIDPSTGLPYFSLDAPLTFVFYYAQPQYPKPSQITIVHVISSGPYQGTYSLSNCKGSTVPPWGCVAKREQVTIGSVTYSVLTVTTPQNDDWFGY